MRRGRPGRWERSGLRACSSASARIGCDEVPLVVGVLQARFLQRGADQLAEAGGDGLGDAQRLTLRQLLGGGELAVHLLGEEGEGAQAQALLRLAFG